MQIKYIVAIAATVVALVGLALVAMRDSKPSDSLTGSTTSTATVASTRPQTTTTSIEIPEDWFPKGSSRYSDREPHTSITTLAPTTTMKSMADSTDPEPRTAAGDR